MGFASPNNQNEYSYGNSNIPNNVRTGNFGALCYAIKQQQMHWRQRKWMNERAEQGTSYDPTYVEHCANTFSHAVMILPSIMAGRIDNLLFNQPQIGC